MSILASHVLFSPSLRSVDQVFPPLARLVSLPSVYLLVLNPIPFPNAFSRSVIPLFGRRPFGTAGNFGFKSKSYAYLGMAGCTL